MIKQEYRHITIDMSDMQEHAQEEAKRIQELYKLHLKNNKGKYE